MIDTSYNTEIVRYDLSDPDIRLPAECRRLLAAALRYEQEEEYVGCLYGYYLLYQKVPHHPEVAYGLAKAFAAAGLTELAIRTFERTFEIADAFEEMESGFRDYYRNEAAWHANSLRENQDARYVNAAILARADPKQLRLLHSTFMEAQMLTLLRPGRLSEIDYLNALFGGNGRPIGDPWEGVVRIARMHPNASEGEVVVLSLGKYYKSGSEEARDATDVTEGILAAKKGNGYPQEWAELVARRISGHAAHCGQRGTGVVVCCVPARPGSQSRMEPFLSAVSCLIAGQTVECDALALGYREGVRSQHNDKLDRKARFNNVRDHMYVADRRRIAGKSVVVIDDVATSGATFFYADRYLREAGASEVVCLALAHTA